MCNQCVTNFQYKVNEVRGKQVFVRSDKNIAFSSGSEGSPSDKYEAHLNNAV
jgi:hypothetical protein